MTCDFCKQNLDNQSRIDGRTKYGFWAMMCKACHKMYGSGLGTGKGQLYNATGVKVQG